MRNTTNRYTQMSQLSLTPWKWEDFPDAFCCSALVALAQQGRRCERSAEVRRGPPRGAPIDSGAFFRRATWRRRRPGRKGLSSAVATGSGRLAASAARREAGDATLRPPSLPWRWKREREPMLSRRFKASRKRPRRHHAAGAHAPLRSGSPQRARKEQRAEEKRKRGTWSAVGGAPLPPKSGRAPPLALLLALFEKD